MEIIEGRAPAAPWERGRLQRLGSLLDGLGSLLGRFWGRLGASWEPLGSLLGASWCLLGASWVPLGVSWGVLEASWGPLGSFLGLPWEPLEVICGISKLESRLFKKC